MKRKSGGDVGDWVKKVSTSVVVAWLAWVSNTLVNLEKKVKVLEFAVLQKTNAPSLLSYTPPPRHRLIDFDEFIFQKGETKHEKN